MDAYQTWEYDIATDTLSEVCDDSDRLLLNDINSFGTYSGYAEFSEKRNRVSAYPVAFDPTTGIIWKATSQSVGYWGLNDPSVDDLLHGVTLGDILIRRNDWVRFGLYNPVYGELNIDDLIDASDPDRAAWLLLTQNGANDFVMSEKRPDTNFGAIAGKTHPDGVPFILVPKPFTRP